VAQQKGSQKSNVDNKRLMTHEKNRDFSFELKKIFFVFFDCGSWASSLRSFDKANQLLAKAAKATLDKVTKIG